MKTSVTIKRKDHSRKLASLSSLQIENCLSSTYSEADNSNAKLAVRLSARPMKSMIGPRSSRPQSLLSSVLKKRTSIISK